MSKEVNIGSELADLIIAITTLANTHDVNLTKEITSFQERLASRHKSGY